MITCPWCGTSYQTFQTSCGKCGGPLPAEQKQDGRSPRSLAAPPPAPRAFHEEYARRLVQEDEEAGNGTMVAFTGGFLLTCMVLLPVVLSGVIGIRLTDVFDSYGLPVVAFVLFDLLLFAFALYLLVGGISIVRERDKELQKMVDVMRIGQATVGEIVEVRENRKQTQNDRHPWEIYYRYKVNGGQRMHGKIVTQNIPGARYQPGCEVNVLYLPDEPNRSVLYPHP
jgi:hypothetical protein